MLVFVYAFYLIGEYGAFFSSFLPSFPRTYIVVIRNFSLLSKQLLLYHIFVEHGNSTKEKKDKRPLSTDGKAMMIDSHFRLTA